MNNVIKKRKIILNKYIKTIIYWIISYTIRGKLWNEVMILPARIFVHRNQQKKMNDLVYVMYNLKLKSKKK